MVKIYKVDGLDDIVCQDLTYGFLVKVETGEISDTKINVILDGTDLNEDAIMGLRKHQVDELFEIIMQLTYPELYNEDGSRKDLDDITEDSDNKKKV